MGIEKDYKLLLENIAGLMVIDTDGNLVYMNERCADYIKADPKKSIGKYINEVFPPSTMTNLLKGNKQYNCNFYFVDGRMSVSSQIQLRKNGKIVGVLEYDLFEETDELDEFLNMYRSRSQRTRLLPCWYWAKQAQVRSWSHIRSTTSVPVLSTNLSK